MRWAPIDLAHFARGAGFGRDDVVTAAAVALAGSGGLDHYDVTPGAPGCGHYVGLWTIDTDRYPHYAARELHVPQRAARAAYELCGASRDWSWSAVWRAGTWRPYVDHVAVAATREYSAGPVSPQVTMPHSSTTIRHTLQRGQTLIGELANYRPGRG